MARHIPALRRIVAELADAINADPELRIAGYTVIAIPGGTRMVVGLGLDEDRPDGLKTLVCSVEADWRRQ